MHEESDGLSFADRSERSFEAGKLLLSTDEREALWCRFGWSKLCPEDVDDGAAVESRRGVPLEESEAKRIDAA